jgi:hypothetical protein
MDSTLALVLALIIVALISRWRWPFARCWSCRGSGVNGGSNGRRWGTCGRCGGSGKRRRVGARRDR